MSATSFAKIDEAEDFLKAQGFRIVEGTCDWTNAAGDDAGIYSVDGIWGEVKAWRVEINRMSPWPLLDGPLVPRDGAPK